VLTVTGLSNAEYLISSVALSIDEYYAGVGESPGVWTGRWAEQLGLSGVVEADQLRALVDGRHPVSGEDLLAGSRPRKVLAFDLTFSSPKSVSLLWALGSEEVSDIVAGAHREAVEVALAFLEEHGAVARVQEKGIRRRVKTWGWAVGGFVHRTSREGDPQLHTHCLVANLVARVTDGRFVAFDGGPLHEWARAAGCVYQNHLQRALSERLGMTWGPDRHNTREIAGFSPEQLRAFSKRTAQIETELEASGANYESPALRMAADDEASLATRRGKDHSLTPTLLADRWREEAAQVGLAVRADLDRTVCFRAQASVAAGWEEITAVLVDPEVGLCARSARFTHADVVEHICAISGGRLSTGEVVAMAARFVDSDSVVRLTPDDGDGRRRAALWSTVAHRALEDRTLALIDTLASRPTAAVDAAAVDAALADAAGLGEDQVAAVRVLTGAGGALRAVLSPAGYGKTTMLYSAARAAAGDGRPVIAVATTAKAVAELAGAGLDARTIARLRIDLTDGPLAARTVVVLDEVSQTPTAEVLAVLAAVDACPGGSLWVLGDARQSQPVGPGGMADHIEDLAASGRIPATRLTVNRRQLDPADRQALDLLRRGEVAGSQQLRAGHGWEHEHARPGDTRQAMAAAVCADIDSNGAELVAALVVSHTDAEDLADRIRGHLVKTGVLGGPIITGPGWTSDRDYQAGDRVLLHARVGPSGGRLVNGTTATITRVEDAGLTVRVDRSDQKTLLPASFVAGTRKDGSPNLSHSWARTVDGAQGGTWETCHLLGNAALDAYRGYTGQSRSRQPTHTWNTKPVVTVDYGGVLADRLDPADVVAQALSRQPDPTLAARSDPWTVDRQLVELIGEHERVLAGRPSDPSGTLADALKEMAKAEAWLAHAATVADHSARRLDGHGALAGLSRRSRSERRDLAESFALDRQRANEAEEARDDVAARVAALQQDRDLVEKFDRAEGWRRAGIGRLHHQLDDHWARVIVACVRADDPLAFGVDKLRHARATTAARINQLDARVPADRGEEWHQARRQLPDLIKARHQAQQALTDSHANLEAARVRRWGRHDHDTIAAAHAKVAVGEDRLEQAVAAESDVRDRLAVIASHQQQRQRVITDSTPRRQDLAAALGQLDAALDHTRSGRVRVLADQPPTYQVKRVGEPPRSEAGRAVWCHHALPIEAALDRNDGASPPWPGWSPLTDRARREIAIADRQLQSSGDGANPSRWAELAQEAATICDDMIKEQRNRQAAAHDRSLAHQAEHHLHIDQSLRPAGPQIGP
jgi:conjugative relaxase-like TrwC/TraI family protein